VLPLLVNPSASRPHPSPNLRRLVSTCPSPDISTSDALRHLSRIRALHLSRKKLILSPHGSLLWTPLRHQRAPSSWCHPPIDHRQRKSPTEPPCRSHPRSCNLLPPRFSAGEQGLTLSRCDRPQGCPMLASHSDTQRVHGAQRRGCLSCGPRLIDPATVVPCPLTLEARRSRVHVLTGLSAGVQHRGGTMPK